MCVQLGGQIVHPPVNRSLGTELLDLGQPNGQPVTGPTGHQSGLPTGSTGHLVQTVMIAIPTGHRAGNTGHLAIGHQSVATGQGMTGHRSVATGQGMTSHQSTVTGHGSPVTGQPVF